MCLSKVYEKERDKEKIIAEEASKVVDNNGTIEVYTVFEDIKKREGYFIKEVDLEKNYIILERKMG
ncbi:MAG: CooT family nickel-binding protein [Actinomycetota bacterium]